MIIDQIETAGLYSSLHPRIATGLLFLANLKADTLTSGREEIDGDAIFALHQEYLGKPLTDGKWESHQRYADIHFIYEGEEQIGYAPVNSLRNTTPYDAGQDYALHEGDGQQIQLSKGWFVIFFPHEAHMPGIAIGQPSHIRKVVVKVKL
jgi:biofilm protein TabA